MRSGRMRATVWDVTATAGRLSSLGGHLSAELTGWPMGSRLLERQVYFPSEWVDGARAKVSVAGEWPGVPMMLG
jgi:hypothetical protein